MVETFDSPGSVFRMNHASNYLSLKGTLNEDKEAMLAQIRRAEAAHGDPSARGVETSLKSLKGGRSAPPFRVPLPPAASLGGTMANAPSGIAGGGIALRLGAKRVRPHKGPDPFCTSLRER